MNGKKNQTQWRSTKLLTFEPDLNECILILLGINSTQTFRLDFIISIIHIHVQSQTKN